MTPARPLRRGVRFQTGRAIVEFALVFGVFVMFLLAIVAVAQWGYTLELAAEATRAGARVAVVCNSDSDAPIINAVQLRLPQVTVAAENVVIERCIASTCAVQYVRVGLTGLSFSGFSTLFGLLSIPAFTTELTRESMASAIDGAANPVCA